MGSTDPNQGTGDTVTPGEQPDIDDVFVELADLATMVDSPDEREQVMEAMQTLRRSQSSRLVGRLKDTFDSRDVGEALVGSFVFGIPMIVEGGTLEIGEYLASRPALLLGTVAFGGLLVYGILHAVEFDRIQEDLMFDILPIRLVMIPLIASVMGFGLMTIWGRADWTTPMIAIGQCTVTSIVMAVGGSLGDVIPGT